MKTASRPKANNIARRASRTLLVVLTLLVASPAIALATAWWDNFPVIVASSDIPTIQVLNGDCGFTSGYFADPSWGIYVQKVIDSGTLPTSMHNAGLKYISYYETFGTATSFILELGNQTAEGYDSVYRFYWNWHLLDTHGGAFRWAGAHNYFDAESFCGPYTRLHPIYGAGGRAMTYPDGTPATGYFNNDFTDPRNSLVYDAACSKDILGNTDFSYGYRDEVAGNPQRSGGLLTVNVNGQTHLVGEVSIGKDTACPMWIDQQRSSVLYSVGQGNIDGIWTDNFSPWDNFGYPPVQIAFGNWSVAGFRDYLAANFAASDLASMGVGDVTTFDVRTCLRNKLTALGGSNTNLSDSKWNGISWLDDPVWRAYKIFKRQVGSAALVSYYTASKDSASQMGVPDFGVFGNDIPLFSLGYTRGNLDMVSAELSPGWHMGTSARGFMMPPVGRFAPMYKLAREHAKSRFVNIWMYLSGTFAPYKEAPGAVNTIYYEMLANHAMPMLLIGNAQGTQSVAINGGFTGFVKSARGTFGARDFLADVGIYYSTSSILEYMTPLGFYDMNNQPHTGAYNGWGTALGNLHYQYRPIPEWKLTPDVLAGLKVLIIPNSEVFDAADATNVLGPWVRAGGCLIVTGNSGNRQGEAGNFSISTSGLSLASLTGVSTYDSSTPATQLTTVGAGKVYYINANIGLSYFNASTTADRDALLANFSNAMNSVLGSTRTLVAPLSAIPETLGLNLYEDSSAQRFFIDANNYDVTLATDAVNPSAPVSFTVKAPSWLQPAQTADLRCQVLSPTASQPVTLTKSGSDRIQVDLGPVTNYSSIVVTADISFTTVVLSTTASGATTTSPIAVTATFTRPVTGFTASDLLVSNASVTGLTGSGANYSFMLVPTQSGTANVSIAGSAVQDNLGYGNVASGSLTYTVATPVFNPAGGAQSASNANISLSCATPGSTIYYTTDGSDPSQSSSAVSSGTVSVPVPCVFKAAAWATGMNPSPIASATFTVAPFAAWAGFGVVPTPTLVLSYAIGGASDIRGKAAAAKPANAPTGFYLPAIVRTNDPGLTIFGETATDLVNGPWSTAGLSVAADPDQTGVPSGCERRRFSLPPGSGARQFLRLKAILTQ